MRFRSIIARISLYFVLIINSIIIITPLYLIIVNSLKNKKDMFTRNAMLLPTGIEVKNYTVFFQSSDNYLIHYRNSIFVAATSIMILIILSSLCAYALATYKFPLNKVIYLIFIVGLFIPLRLGTINIAQIMIKLNLYDNLFSLVIIYIASGLPFAIFILTDFMRLIPKEFSNAARIDGCSDIGIFVKIMLPLVKPAIVTVTLFNLIWIWNDFWFPLILIKGKNLMTVPFAASKYMGQYITDYGAIYANLVMATIPLLLVYLFLSRYYLQGITSGALKE